VRKSTAAKPAVTVATLSLAWSVGTALPATGETRTDVSRTAPSEGALSSVPRPYLTWYQRAARTCPGLGWPVLAGIGEVESDHGQSTLPGVHDAANFAGAEGPMQFEPRTFAAYAVKADPSHALSVYDPEDAIFTAARMLCDDGAAGGSPQGINTALYAYNHAGWYQREVLSWAARYAGATSTVVFRRSVPAPPVHSNAGHHQDHPQPVHHISDVHPAHRPPAAAATTHGGRTESAEVPSLGTEAMELAAEAGQLASEAHALSGEAQQLTAEARQLSGEAQQPPSPAQQSASSAAEPPQPVLTTPADTLPAPAAPPALATPLAPAAPPIPAAPSATAPAPAPTPPGSTAPDPTSPPVSGSAPPTQTAAAPPAEPAAAPPAEPESAPAALLPSTPAAEPTATTPATATPATSAAPDPTVTTPATPAPKPAGEPAKGHRLAADQNPAPLPPPSQSAVSASGPSAPTAGQSTAGSLSSDRGSFAAIVTVKDPRSNQNGLWFPSHVGLAARVDVVVAPEYVAGVVAAFDRCEPLVSGGRVGRCDVRVCRQAEEADVGTGAQRGDGGPAVQRGWRWAGREHRAGDGQDLGVAVGKGGRVRPDPPGFGSLRQACGEPPQ
jgi:hypothetical protein